MKVAARVRFRVELGPGDRNRGNEIREFERKTETGEMKKKDRNIYIYTHKRGKKKGGIREKDEEGRRRHRRSPKGPFLSIRKRGLMCIGGPGTRGLSKVVVTTAVREGGSVEGFGALPRREHPLARELYYDHRYHTTERPRLVLVDALEEATERHGPRGGNRWNDPSCELAGRA